MPMVTSTPHGDRNRKSFRRPPLNYESKKASDSFSYSFFLNQCMQSSSYKCWNIHWKLEFIHYKDLYSTFSRGTTQKCSQPQLGRITQIWIVEGMFESGFCQVNQGKVIPDWKTKCTESTILPGGGASKRNLKETLLSWAKWASAQSTVDGSAELSQVGGAKLIGQHQTKSATLYSILCFTGRHRRTLHM